MGKFRLVIDSNMSRLSEEKIDRLYDEGLNSIKTVKFKNTELLKFTKLIKERKK